MDDIEFTLMPPPQDILLVVVEPLPVTVSKVSVSLNDVTYPAAA